MTGTDSALRTAAYVVLFLIAIPVLMMVLMMPMMAFGGGWDMHSAWHGTGGTWSWGLMMLVPIILLGGLGYLLYTVTSSPSTHSKDSALVALREAYARGDLSDEEFEKRRQRLTQD